MIDHVGLQVGDYERSKAFYSAALRPLGYELVMEPDTTVGGFGAQGKPDFWIIGGTPSSGTHIAFETPDRATVDAFHAASLEAGAPGARRTSCAQDHTGEGLCCLNEGHVDPAFSPRLCA